MSGADTSIRTALNAAAGEYCPQFKGNGGRLDLPCYGCRMVARDIIMTFLTTLPPDRITPLELRLRLAKQGSDG